MPLQGQESYPKNFTGQFEVSVEARARLVSWRLSWEQRRRGTLPHRGASQETSDIDASRSSSPAVPLQGKIKLLQDLH